MVLLPLSWSLYLLSYLVPRISTLVAFGVQSSSYSGNVRTLLEQPGPHLDKVFISSTKTLAAELNARGIKAYWRFSFNGALTCLRAKTYVFSNYPSDINFWLSGGARLINVWHGTPIKKIEKDISTGYYGLRNRHKWLVKIVAPYLVKKSTAVLVSSPYEEECFKTAFKLPESDFFRCFPPRLEELMTAPPEIGGPIEILYTPTWRDDHSFSITDYLEFNRLSSFLERQNAYLSVKLHPSDKMPSPDIDGPRITVLDQQSDIYEHLKVTTLVVTDYSSLMFDAIYLGKEVILFTPDIGNYLEKSRSLYIDPAKDIGLTNAASQQALETAIELHIRQGAQPVNLTNQFSPYPICRDIQQTLLTPTAKP